MALKSSLLWFRRNWRKTSSRFWTSRGPRTIRADFYGDRETRVPAGGAGHTCLPTEVGLPVDQARETQDAGVSPRGGPHPTSTFPRGRGRTHLTGPTPGASPGLGRQPCLSRELHRGLCSFSTALPGAGRDAGPGDQVPPL